MMSISSKEAINDIFRSLFHELSSVEKKVIITEEFKDISNNELHVIEAIGMGVDNTMSMVAKKLGITAGTLTTSINNLVNKKYVLRSRGKTDRRKVYISLSEKGQEAFRQHSVFYKKLTEALVNSLEQEEVQVLLKSLSGLSSFFKDYRGVKR